MLEYLTYDPDWIEIRDIAGYFVQKDVSGTLSLCA